MSTPSDSYQWTLVSRKGRSSHNASSDSPVSGGPGKGRRSHNPTNNIPVVGDRSTSQGQQPAPSAANPVSDPQIPFMLDITSLKQFPPLYLNQQGGSCDTPKVARKSIRKIF